MPKRQVVAVDHTANTISLDAAIGNPAVFVGRVAIFGNELQQTSYIVRSATVKDGQTVIGFGDTLFLVQMGMARDNFELPEAEPHGHGVSRKSGVRLTFFPWSMLFLWDDEKRAGARREMEGDAFAGIFAQRRGLWRQKTGGCSAGN